MEIMLALAILGFVAWWLRYNQLYRAGAVKLPFFSLGTAQHPQKIRVSDRPATAQARIMDVARQQEVGKAVNRVTTYTHNHEVSVRLLQAERVKNPGRSVTWCAEKVINDIVRDRR